MELVPVVEVVQVDRVAWFSIGKASSAEDALAGVVGMDVADDGGVEFLDGGFVDLAPIVRDPLFTLDVGGFGGDEGEEGIAVETEAVEDHLVVALAAAGVAFGELARRFEGGFKPKAGKVKNAERTGDSGADEWNDFGHSDNLLGSAVGIANEIAGHFGGVLSTGRWSTQYSVPSGMTRNWRSSSSCSVRWQVAQVWKASAADRLERVNC